MKFIDCTIRDGGHRNKWNFPNQMVVDSYNAAIESGVDFFEVGYRNPKDVHGLGAFGYCDDLFIKELLPLNENTKLLVMVDANKYTPDSFAPAKDSPFWGVRVAFYPPETESATHIADELLEKGYHVFFNPMLTEKLQSVHYDIIYKWKNKSKVEAVYIADSFGSFVSQELNTIIDRFMKIGIRSLGVHAHNNLQMAVSNTLLASHLVNYCDGTIFGMGRGAGNAPIEILLAILRNKNPIDYYSVIEEWYRNDCDWGALPEYISSAFYGIHPNFATELHEKASYEELDEIMKRGLPVNYNPNSVPRALEQLEYDRIRKGN